MASAGSQEKAEQKRCGNQFFHRFSSKTAGMWCLPYLFIRSMGFPDPDPWDPSPFGDPPDRW